MNIAELPLPTTQSKKLKYFKNLHMNQRLHLKKVLESQQVPGLLASNRNRLMAQQELNNLTNDKNRIDNIMGKGSLAYKTYIKDNSKRYEELKKIISN
jgi:hypothetical protein